MDLYLGYRRSPEYIEKLETQALQRAYDLSQLWDEQIEDYVSSFKKYDLLRLLDKSDQLNQDRVKKAIGPIRWERLHETP